MALALGGSKAATPRALAADLPSRYPEAQLVVPRKVVFKAPDGLDVHAQLFERAGGDARAGTKKPAVIFVHGGPPRQMLLGWHYSDYYSNAYALNQYLASRGFVVLAVNYRLGIGYGYEFHRPPQAGAQGASEYQDVKAAGEYLRTLPQVDPRRIGIYGGSYGGFLTALALARDSALFAAGVDIHGVHDWAGERARPLLTRDRYETAPDLAEALEAAWRSSPISQVSTWKSPVLLIHGDDDRNPGRGAGALRGDRDPRRHAPLHAALELGQGRRGHGGVPGTEAGRALRREVRARPARRRRRAARPRSGARAGARRCRPVGTPGWARA